LCYHIRIEAKGVDLYSAMELISKALRMARVKGITHINLPPARLSANGMSHPAFTPSRRASPHFDRYDTHSRPTEHRRLSWPRWLVIY